MRSGSREIQLEGALKSAPPQCRFHRNDGKKPNDFFNELLTQDTIMTRKMNRLDR
jgi:hypothetical protein